jgi:hypothetical protein
MFYRAAMDRNFAIEHNHGRLVGVVAGLLAMIGLTEGAMVERLSKPLYRKVRGILRSAESALRRLIIAAARDIVVEPQPKRPAPAERKSFGESNANSQGKGNRDGTARRKRAPLFNLFDRPRRKDWGIPRRRKRRQIVPRVLFIDYDPRIPEFLRPQAPAAAHAPIANKAAAIADGTVSAIRLCRRIFAAKAALKDIPRQARRFARWRDKPKDERRPRRASPFRLGWPPGWRIRPTHEVDEILKDCHWLVRNLDPQLDTS